MALRRTVQLVAGTRQPRLYFFERHEVCCLRRHNHPSISNSSSRPFSSSAPFAYPQGAQASQKRLGGNASPRSFAVMQKEVQKQLMDSGRVFEEYGVLPGTFVTQRSSERPREWKDRWEWEQARLKARFLVAYQFLAVKFFMVRTHPPEHAKALGFLERVRYALFGWHKFEVLSAASIADALYKDMYTALAAGDVETLQRKVRRDMLQSLRSRIAGRGAGIETQWTLNRHLRKPRLVAYQVALLDPNRPKWRQSWMQQAVVEIDTEQSLTTRRKGSFQKGQAADKTEKGQVREYVVIQKDVVDGVAGPWKIWGTTKPTTLDDVRRDAEA